MSIYDDFVAKIDNFVASKLNNYVPSVTYGKVIHDPIWGSVFYYHWEVQIIDSPLYQRLRDLNQVGLAMLTYPAARHSRFEHSLGTVAIASRIFERIMEKKSRQEEEKIPYLDEEGLYLIRLAALLHDVGHCFYSHLSECIYGEMDEFKEIISVFKEKFDSVKPKPHEIFSYLIAKSASFQKFFKDYVDYPYKTDNLLDMAANTIIGVSNAKSDEGKTLTYSYLTSLINGDFDADKLDYIMRDSYTAGLALTYDIERFLYKINVFCHQASPEQTNYLLVIEFSGITSVEELTFSKLMLFSYIYHHQKILAAEAVLKDVTYGLIKLGVLKHPCDFLNFTDSDIIAGFKNDTSKPFEDSTKTIGELIRRVMKRNLPKKCFVLNRKMVQVDSTDIDKQKIAILEDCYKGITGESDLVKIFDNLENFAMQYTRFDDGNHSIGIRSIEGTFNEYHKSNYEQYITLRKSFCEELKEECRRLELPIDFDFLDVHIIFPNKAKFTSSNSSVVLFIDKTLKEIDKVMNLHDWSDSFNANKWNGYVFINDNINTKIAHAVAEKIIIKNPAIKLINSEAYVKNLTE